MNTAYVSAGPPVWAYILGVPILIAGICAWVNSMQPGQKVKCWKIVDGRKVRDYDAERRLRQDTKP